MCIRDSGSLKTAWLLGLGGAGGRAYKKWEETLKEHQKRKEKAYVVCNGDESEPATFKDRELFLRTPHLVVRGVILAGLLLGATRGYIYILSLIHISEPTRLLSIS